MPFSAMTGATASLNKVFDAQCRALGDQPAFGFLDGKRQVVAQWNYRELAQQSHALADRLAQLTAPGDRVLLALPPGLDFVRVFWACLLSGRVAVPVPAPDPQRLKHAAPRLRAIAQDAAAALVLSTADLLSAASAVLDAAAFEATRWTALADLDARAAPLPDGDEVSGDAGAPAALAYLQYTSGSTTEPRGVRLTHANVLANARALAERMRIGPNSRLLTWLPHFHDYGLVGGVLLPVITGAPSWSMSPLSFLRRPIGWLEAIAELGITHSGGPESAYAALLAALDGKKFEGDLSRVVSLSCGAEPIRPATLERLQSALADAGLHAEAVMPGYGLAESVVGVSMASPDAPLNIATLDGEALRAHRVQRVRGEVAAEDAISADAASTIRRVVGCGQPLPGTEIRIVDADTRQPCAADSIGEIWVRSAAVGDGYWMRPEASQECFGAALSAAGHRDETTDRTDDRGGWLRTGDLGFLHAGELFVTGRLKDLVIVHGENHYPQDLEWTAERAHPDLRIGHGAAFSVEGISGAEGSEGLALLLELDRRGSAADPQAVFAAVRQAIGEAHGFSVQQIGLLRAGSLPRTSSGKIQRRRARAAWRAGELTPIALDGPASGGDAESPNDESGAPTDMARVMPRDANEQLLWDVWSEVLATTAFGVHDSFFTLGGSSLVMTQVLSRIGERLGVQLPLTAMFEHDSIAALAGDLVAALDAAGRGADRDTLSVARIDRLSNAERQKPLPTSLSQRRMWLIQQFDPQSTAYHVAVPLRLRGALDADAMQRTADLMVARHEGLRTRFVMGESEPMQSVAPTIAFAIEQIDLRELPAQEREAEAAALLSRRHAEPFDLAQAPLHRLTLLTLAEDDHVLFWLMHHAITDNWSTAVLMREALTVYTALARGKQDAAIAIDRLLPPIAVEYTDYAAWQRSPEATAAREGALAHWVERLKGLPELELPTDFVRPARPSFKGARVSAPLPPALREALHAMGKAQSATPFMILLAAFMLLLSRQARSTDVAVGTPIANRHRFAAEHLVGTLVNTLVMRVDLGGDPSFAELVARVRAVALDAYTHQEAPFDELTDALGHDRQAHPEGLVRVLFNVLNAPIGRVAAAGLDVGEFDFERSAAQFDLSVHVDTEFSQRVHLEYASDLYAPATAQRMLDNYLALVEAVLAQPERQISSFPMLAPAQLQIIKNQWNGLRVPLPAERRLDLYLDLGRPELADRIGVIDADGRAIHYGELEASANAMARALRAMGVARGARVGLCIERSPWMLVAQLAVFKAGGAYVPLDPAYPPDRLRYMAEDAAVAVVLTLGAPEGLFEGLFDGLGVPLVAVDDPGFTAGHDDAPLAPDAARDAGEFDEAYVIYTSGSTGQPKGVRVPHHGVVNFLQGMIGMIGLSQDDCVMAITSPSFDPSVLDLLMPLVVGAKTVIASYAQSQDPVLLRGLLETHRATLLQATPSAFRMLIDAGWQGGPHIRGLIGGESLPPVLAEALLERLAELWNIYGPTESTVWATGWRAEAPRRGIAIGRPIANVQVWPLDPHGHPCQIGAPGELVIGGDGVTPGYNNLPEQTSERFVPDPFSNRPDARMYRTGDLGRWRHDGQLEHLGRVDFQVKLRGFRIELGEIESALLDHPALAYCVVVTRAESEEDVRLVAYVVAHSVVNEDGLAEPTSLAPSAAELREHLRARLPHYMVPQHFVALAALPRLPNGKVDRAVLPAPAPEPSVAAVAGGRRAEPLNANEQAVARIWGDLLQIDDVRRDDNFFDLGGHSLLAMRAVTAIKDQLGWRIDPPRFVYETLGQIANPANVGGPRRR